MKKIILPVLVVGTMFSMLIFTNSLVKADEFVSTHTSQMVSSSSDSSTIDTTFFSGQVSMDETTGGADLEDKNTTTSQEMGTDNTDAEYDNQNQTIQKLEGEGDNQDEINEIGKGENFNSKLYLNYFGNKLKEVFQTSSDDNLPVHLFLLLLSEKQNSPSKFEVEQSVIQHLMSTYILYDIAFAKESNFMTLMSTNDGTTPSGNTGFYPHTEEIEEEGLNYQNGQNMNLKAYYVNQNSDKTVIIHGGFRGNWSNGIVTPEYDHFYKSGYNLLFVASRATGGSGGDYITYGQYESDDVLHWIDWEIQKRPNQSILLYGGSMGASTMMSALAKNIPHNVKGIIENCGFSSIDAQLRFTYSNIVAPALNSISGISSILDIIGDQTHEDLYLGLLKDNYFDQDLHLNLIQNLPEIGMETTSIPKLIIHGSADDVVPATNAQKIYDLSKGYKDMLIVEGAGHGKAQEVDPVAYDQHLTDFLRVIFDDQVNVKYLDENGKSLISQDQISLHGTYGDLYKTQQKEFENYDFVSVEGEIEGKFSEKTPTVVYIYKEVKDSEKNDNAADTTDSANQDTLGNKKLNENDITPKVITNERAIKEGTQKLLPTTGDKKIDLYFIIGGLLLCSVILALVIKLKFGEKR